MNAITLTGADHPDIDAILQRLREEDAVGQLLRREGRMAALATEGGDVKLDWVDGVQKALAHPEWLQQIEEEAAEILRPGIRHIIWAGMGGSVQTVYTLKRWGYLDLPNLHIYPLDSTDPATLNRLAEQIAASEGTEEPFRLLRHTMMIGVSMGMTSEEPITHLEWFDGLLQEYSVPASHNHIQVMTLPGSYLDQFAETRGARRTPIQLDGENHTPGRMSAPATRVFLRPVCLALAAAALERNPDAAFDGSLIRPLLERVQALAGISSNHDSPFVRLAAFAAHETLERKRNKIIVVLPDEAIGLVPWIEQVVEESLGKGGKGLLIFYGEELRDPDRYGDDVMFLQVILEGGPEPAAAKLAALQQAGLPVLALQVPVEQVPGMPLGLPELAALMLGWELTVAIYGYLTGIVFAGQPAVEGYKRYARELREAPEPVGFNDSAHLATYGSITLHYSTPVRAGLLTDDELDAELASLDGRRDNAADVYAALLRLARRGGWLRYLDFTFNGEMKPEMHEVLEDARRVLAQDWLQAPAKLRTGPADYHSTEQSETDGPNELVSTRLVALVHEDVRVGSYSDKFLLAQARGTWQAMEDAGRFVLMITLPTLNEASLTDLRGFFSEVRDRLGGE